MSGPVLLQSAHTVAGDNLRLLEGNVARAEVKGASRREALYSAHIQGGSTTRISLRHERDVDEFAMQMQRMQASMVDYHSAMKDGIDSVQKLIGDVTPGEAPKLIKVVDGFFNSLERALASPQDAALKTIIVSEAQNLCGAISATASACYQAKQSAQLQLSEKIEQLNANIKELVRVNRNLSEAHAAGVGDGSLEDERDRLVGEISSCIAVEAPRYSENGTVLLRSAGIIILDKETHLSFSYKPELTISEISDGSPLGVISYDIITNGPEAKTVRTDILYDSARGNKLMPTGAIKGLADLHDNMIPKYLGALGNLAFNLREHLNRIHNSGSPYPGRSLVLGSQLVRGSDETAWAGSAKIAIVGADGMPLKTSEGPNGYVASPLNLDLASLSRISRTGTVSTRDIINEINARFGPNTSQAVGMGPSLSDFRMVAQKSAAGQFSFDFEGLNKSDFDTKIEILEVTPPAGSGIIGSLPEMATIERGQQKRTFQTINLTNPGLAGMQDITVKVRTIGADGTVKEGAITFSIDFGNIPANGARISGAPAAAAPGDFANIELDRRPFMKASLVDKDGNEIFDNYTQGFIKIEAEDSKYKIAMQDDDSLASLEADGFGRISRGFAHFYGLNNFINSTDKSARYALDMQVRPDITVDPQLFSSARLIASSKKYKIGDERATRNIDFAAGMPQAIDTITINGRVYTFGVAPGHLAVPGNINDLVDSLNARAELKNLLTFSAEGNNLVIKAKNAGSGGNAITIAYNIGLLGAPGPLNLAGGTDKDIMLQETGLSLTSGDSSIYADFAKMQRNGVSHFSNKQISFPRGSFASLAACVTNFMTQQYDDAVSSHKLEKIVLDSAVEKYKSLHGFDKEKQVAELMKIQDFMKQIIFAMSLRHRMEDYLLDRL